MQFPNSAYSGYSSLIATAYQLLELAEECYGKSVKPVKMSVEEWESDHPETFFDLSFTHATIKIQKVQKGDENQRRYQLAQEVIQCLSPVPPDELTFLEKGLAQVFAHCPKVSVGIEGTKNIKYAEARDLCESLMKNCGKDIVRRLREREPYIPRIKPDLIIEFCPNFPSELAKSLCKRWD